MDNMNQDIGKLQVAAAIVLSLRAERPEAQGALGEAYERISGAMQAIRDEIAGMAAR